MSTFRLPLQLPLQLYRILCMLVIIAHHYVVNSGLTTLILGQNEIGAQDFFLLLFGCGGKIAINSFVLITGYYMCQLQITSRKWLRLLGEIEFYKISIYVLLLLSGYETFDIHSAWTIVFPFSRIESNFIGCYLLFYGFIPFLNRLIESMNEHEHRALIALGLFTYTVLPSFLFVNISFNYITWFGIVYLLAAYMRIYPRIWFDDAKAWTCLSLGSVVLSFGSIVIIALLARMFGFEQLPLFGLGYYWVNDSNKILAIVTAVCTFMLFKNLHVQYSRLINAVAKSTFGVLLIHAHSDGMRQWLWWDVCRNVEQYDKWYLPIHAVGCVIIIFVICCGIDTIRVQITEWLMDGIHLSSIKV